MIGSLTGRFFLAWFLLGSISVTAQQTPAAQEPPAAIAQEADSDAVDESSSAQDAATSQANAEAPDGETQVPPQLQPAATQLELEMGPDGRPKGFQEELDKRIAAFRKLRGELEIALGDQRETYVRYVNAEDNSRAAEGTFQQQRLKVRRLLDQAYLAALDVVRLGPDQEAATFLVTMIQHRLERDIYDEVTMEGAARMIDGGSNLLFLYQAAARSAVIIGEFDMAKRLLEAIDEEQLKDVDLALKYNMEKYKELYEAEKPIREKEAKEDRLPRVAIKTTQGDAVIELFLDQAPSTVSHFIGLVEEGFYDDLDFHQVIDHLVAMTGDPSGVGSGNCGKFLMDEHLREDARKGFRGSLTMAKIPLGDSGKFAPNSASSQFAILLMPIISVSEEQTIFGRVIEGMDVISRLRRVDPSKKKGKGEIVIPADRIIEATVIRRPETLPDPEYNDLNRR